MLARRLVVLLISGALSTLAASNVGASTPTKGRETGLPLPRFVSLAADLANMRFGPGFKYDVKYIYTAPGIPLQVFQEFDNWRHVRDPEGDTGWVHSSLLSGRRTGVVQSMAPAPLPLRAQPDATSPVEAFMEDGLVVELVSCGLQWCRVSAESGSYGGYARREALWGSAKPESF